MVVAISISINHRHHWVFQTKHIAEQGA